MSLLAFFLAAQGEVQRGAFALVSVDTLVDAIVARVGLLVDQQVAADLLWTPAFFQFGFNQFPGFGLHPRSVCAGLLVCLCE